MKNKFFSVITAMMCVLFIGMSGKLVYQNVEATRQNTFNGEFTIENASSQKEFLNNIDKKYLNYVQTLYSETNDSFEKLYKDSKDNVYLYSSDDTLKGFYTNEFEKSSSSVNLEIIEQFAQQYLIALTNDESSYVLEQSFYNEAAGCYMVTFIHYYGDIRTTDNVCCLINDEGELIGFSVNNNGRFNDLSYSVKDIHELVEEHLNNISADFTESQFVLSLDDEENIIVMVDYYVNGIFETSIINVEDCL